MQNDRYPLAEWGAALDNYRLPRWEELPAMQLYKDQIITLAEGYLSIFPEPGKILSSAMINNYVKLRLVPPPRGKRYGKEHLAHFIAISVLKQILTVTEVHQGIEEMDRLCGLEAAYNIFCDELENALRAVGAQAAGKKTAFFDSTPVPRENQALKMALLSVASKLYTQRLLSLSQEKLSEEPPKKKHRENTNNKEIKGEQ